MASTSEGELALGRVGAPHGLDGRAKFVSFSGDSSHIGKLGDVTLRKGDDTRRVRVTGASPAGDGALIKFEGYDSPEAVRSLAGYELWAPRSKASRLEPGQFYYADLVGCSLVSGDEVVASVEGVCEGGGGDLLEVRRPGHEPEYVPFRKEFIGKVDVAARRIELIAPWILE